MSIFEETVAQLLDVVFRQSQSFGQIAVDGAVLLENLVARCVDVATLENVEGIDVGHVDFFRR